MRPYCKYVLLIIFLYAVPSFSTESSSQQSQVTEAQDQTEVRLKDSLQLNAIPYKKDTELATSSIVNLLLFVVLLIGFFVFLFKNKDKLSKMGLIPLEQGKHIVILDRQKLHADNVAYLITVDGKRYLLTLGTANANINLIE